MPTLRPETAGRTKRPSQDFHALPQRGTRALAGMPKRPRPNGHHPQGRAGPLPGAHRERRAGPDNLVRRPAGRGDLRTGWNAPGTRPARLNRAQRARGNQVPSPPAIRGELPIRRRDRRLRKRAGPTKVFLSATRATSRAHPNMRMLIHHFKAVGLPVTITQDRSCARLREETRLRIMANARRLIKLEFRQQERRPTLFLLQAGQRKIYADLDSTEVMRIWEVDCEPDLYSFPTEGGSGCRECVLDGVGRIFDQNAIPYRRHFEDHIGHDHGWEE